MLKYILFSFFYFYSTHASAYIDPGTGGIIAQAVIGLIAAVSVFFSKIKLQIKKFFEKFKKKNNLKNE